MYWKKGNSYWIAGWILVLAVALSAPGAFAGDPASDASKQAVDSKVTMEEWSYTNPTYLIITPRKNQSEIDQMAAQLECFEWACEYVDWNPYQAYEDLVDQGYAVALSHREMERDLIFLAMQAAVAGEIAGEIASMNNEADIETDIEPDVETDIDPDIEPDPANVSESSASDAAMGAAAGVVMGAMDFSFLLEPDDPKAERAISRYERNLRKWEQKYSGCLRRKGFRVSSEDY